MWLRRKGDRVANYVEHTAGHIVEIFQTADITLAVLILGLSLMAWTTLALITTDILKFSADFIFYAPLFWIINGYGTGLAYVSLALRGLPKMPLFIVGSWSVMAYTWVAVTRPVSSASSGITLNFIVILMGLLSVHRSGRQ